MIPYIEVIGKYDRKPFATIEASQCWFELSYYGIGECEVYAPATAKNLQALRGGNYVRIPNKPYLWVLKTITYTYANGTRMISAKGYEAKWLIGTRIVLSPWTLPTDLGQALYQLVYKNLGLGASSFRKIVGLTVENPSLGVTIEKTQAPRGNVLDLITSLLTENKCGFVSLYSDGVRIHFLKGVDRSSEVMFSQSLDNLLTSEYVYDSTDYKTYAQIVSEFSQNDQKAEYAVQYPQDDPSPTPQKNVGIDRAEIFVQANLSTKYIVTDAQGNPVIDPETGKPREAEYSPTDPEYQAMQRAQGAAALAEHKVLKHFSGEIDLKVSAYRFDEDFTIGDLVGIRDETLGYQEKARILKYTFKQDSGGYSEIPEYESEDS